MLDGHKTYLVALCGLLVAVLFAIQGRYNHAVELALAALGLASLRHAVAKAQNKS